MICTECGNAIEAGNTSCPSCGKPLKSLRPISPMADEPVEILATQDPTLIPVVRSLLDLAEIPYEVRGDSSYSLQPAFDLLTGRESSPIRVFVPASREKEARELLEPQGPPAEDQD